MSTPNVFNILERFKKAYMSFIDELLEQFPNEPDLIIIRVFLEDQVPVSVVADTFVERILPHRGMINNRDEVFFLENNHIFDMVDTGKVIHFKDIWKRLDDDDKDAIWKWFDTLCTIVEAYKKARR